MNPAASPGYDRYCGRPVSFFTKQNAIFVTPLMVLEKIAEIGLCGRREDIRLYRCKPSGVGINIRIVVMQVLKSLFDTNTFRRI